MGEDGFEALVEAIALIATNDDNTQLRGGGEINHHHLKLFGVNSQLSQLGRQLLCFASFLLGPFPFLFSPFLFLLGVHLCLLGPYSFLLGSFFFPLGPIWKIEGDRWQKI
jgi:hypothetical protein